MIRKLGIAACLSLVATSAGAVVGRHAEPPFVSAVAAPRPYRPTAIAPAARMAAAGLAGWTAVLDRDTDVPLQMWGDGVLAPGAIAHPASAETAARAFLAAHLDLLAPGAAPSDFELVANDLTDGIRSIGFQQRAGGLRVVGGGIGLVFVADRLALVTSTALPHVAVAKPAAVVSRATAFARAQTWLGTAGYAIASRDASLVAQEPVIVPFVGSRAIRFHVAHQLSVEDAAAHQRWNVWVDAATGAPIARASTISQGTAKVTYDAPDRGPQGVRTQKPAALATLQVAGAPVTTDIGGNFTFTGTAPVSVALGLVGPRVAITNAQGALASATKQVSNGGTVAFSSSTVEFDDAQLAAFVAANTVKEFVKTKVNPNLDYIDQQLSVSVNEDDVCNAFSTGDDIHFFKAGSGFGLVCENTGRIADVVYHEFGHSLHFHSIIPGVGQFNGSVSEALGDFTSVLLTNDNGLGRGFFSDKPNDALRDLDPVGVEKRFPQDADGEPHDEGEILGEALFDLKKGLEAKLGAGPGRDRLIKIYYSIMQRSVDLPSTYGAALVADDDDGNIANGTPNKCEIDAAFGLHGLVDQGLVIGIVDPTRDGYTIHAPIAPPANACPGAPTITGVQIDWNLRGGGAQPPVTLAADAQGFSGAIPTQPDGSVVQYHLTYTLSNGTTLTYPSTNPVEKYLEFYVGNVRKIACFDFENGAQGWTGEAQWKAGTPLGLAGDPGVAHGGTGVYGLDIDEDGGFDPRQATFAESPEIDVGGAKKVRLQYFRWLTVGPASIDQAHISVNGLRVWSPNMPQDPNSPVGHTDHEWRFSDIDITQQVAGGKVKLKFDLTPGEVDSLGGWTLDDVCVVEPVEPGCGNGFVDPGETCDDGNTVAGDGCSATCQTEMAPPEPTEDGGCCSASGSPAASFGLGALVAGLVLRRRKRG